MFLVSVLSKIKLVLPRMLQERAVRPHRERKRKRWRCDNSKGTARTCDGPPQSFRRPQLKMPGLTLGGDFLVGRAGFSAPGSTQQVPVKHGVEMQPLTNMRLRDCLSDC